MATEKQIQANRRNARKSTGPTSPQGKAAVRLNALRHGLRAKALVLPGENLHDFGRLCDDFEAEWQPRTRTEQALVEQMVAAQWKLRRIEVAEYFAYNESMHSKEQTSQKRELPTLDRLWQAQIRQERSFVRALQELQRLQMAHPSLPAAEIRSPFDAPEPSQPTEAEPVPPTGSEASSSPGNPAPMVRYKVEHKPNGRITDYFYDPESGDEQWTSTPAGWQDPQAALLDPPPPPRSKAA
jgi:hypothetical protein